MAQPNGPTVRLSVLLAAGLALATPAIAWEKDVHYVLTFWLATQAGFSRTAADEIAKGNQGLDDSEYHAAPSSMIWVLFRGDPGAARSVRDNHFPSDGPIPSPPQRRVVAPGGRSARDRLEGLMRRNDASDALRAFGEALHPFQDSWSHQGVPDIPLRPGLRLRPWLSSAHPEARGGWFSKDADRTHLHVTDVINMARETFVVLQRYLEQNPQWRSVPLASDWSALEPIVREFSEASTRQQKIAWAAKHIPQDSPVSLQDARYLSLPGDPVSSFREFRAVQPPADLTAGAEVPADLLDAADSFVDVWISQRDVAAAAEFVDPSAVGQPLAGMLEPLADAGRDGVRQWSRTFLAMYLVADHSEVDGVGHADPRHEEYASMPETVQGDGPFRALSEVQPPELSGDHFVALDEIPPGPGFGVALRMSDLPYEVVAFVWRELDGRWVITSMFYLLN